MKYDYRCTVCKNDFVVEHSMTETPCVSCECGGQAKRLISKGTNFVLKGGCWYNDGYSSRVNTDE